MDQRTPGEQRVQGQQRNQQGKARLLSWLRKTRASYDSVKVDRWALRRRRREIAWLGGWTLNGEYLNWTNVNTRGFQESGHRPNVVRTQRRIGGGDSRIEIIEFIGPLSPIASPRWDMIFSFGAMFPSSNWSVVRIFTRLTSWELA